MIKLFRISSFLWMVFIFFLSSLTRNDLRNLPYISDILGHGVLYLVLGALLYYSIKRHRGLFAVLISALYGLTDEFHQAFVPGRTPELKDLLVDVAAAIIAVAIIKAGSYVIKARH